MKQITLGELAKFLRSKNAGPFLLTFDVFFHQRADYEMVRDSGVINVDSIARLYRLSDKQKISIFAFDKVAAIKITIPRSIASGGVGDTDIYGAQQHAPLASVLVPYGDAK